MIKALALAVTLMVHGIAAASCDGNGAANLVDQLDQFNSMLVNYASVGSSALAAATPTHTAAKGKEGFVHLDVRSVENHPPKVNEKSSLESSKAHSSQHSQIPTIAIQQPQTHKQAEHQINNAKPVAHHTDIASQVAAKPKQQQQQQQQQHPSENENHIDPQVSKELKMIAQNSFTQLNEQQHHLNSLAEVCIPISHKLKVVSAFSRVFSTYIVHSKNLKAAGKLVEKPKSKPKAGNKNAKGAKVKRQQPGWLTMGDDVNGGYNGDMNELTSTSSTTTSSSLAAYGYPEDPYMGQPQYQTAYITVTTTSTPSPSPSPSKSKKGSASSDTSGTDTSSESSDDESTSAAAPAPAAPTKAHHGIIYDTFDGTFHLVTGTLHLIERILHIGGSHQSSAISNADQKAAKGSHNTGDETANEPGTGELVSLVDRVSRLYSVNI